MTSGRLVPTLSMSETSRFPIGSTFDPPEQLVGLVAVGGRVEPVINPLRREDKRSSVVDMTLGHSWSIAGRKPPCDGQSDHTAGASRLADTELVDAVTFDLR